MCGGRSFEADAAFAWPTAEICAMSIEGAVDVAFKRDYQNADAPAAKRQAMLDRIKTQTAALGAAKDFGDDEIIATSATRGLLLETFNTTPRRKPDRNPPRYRAISPI